MVKVKQREKAARLDRITKEALKEAGMMDANNKLKITGVSAKMLRVMKMEYVDCPVLDREVQFVQCYVCPNYQSRYRKEVMCLGETLSDDAES